MRWPAIILTAFFFFTAVGVGCGSEGVAEMRKLPEPDTDGSIPVEQAKSARRSVRSFTEEKLTDAQIGQLAWAAQGITSPRGLRTAPSAGALYPLEIYLVTPEGVDHYVPRGHGVRRVLDDDVRAELAKAALNQRCVAEAPLCVVIVAVYERVTSRYGERGRMYVHMEAGHAAQNVFLQAVALNLGGVAVGAFNEQAVHRILQLPDGHVPVYILPIGHPRR